MLSFKQLDLFARFRPAAPPAVTPHSLGRDPRLEERAAEWLHSLGERKIARAVQVVWNPRLRTAAGRADCRGQIISLNPLLFGHSAAEIERTFLHELAHLLAQSRAGRRRIPPHGPEWRQACADLGIAGEARCHSLPFRVQRRARPYFYRCPACALEFPRTRRLRRAMACLACCRRLNRGRFDRRCQLELVAVTCSV